MANPTWTDASDNWTTAADWSTGVVPGAPDDVTIAEGDPQVTSNVGTVASVAVTGSGELDIGSGGVLATTGALTSTGTILLEEGGSLSVGATAGFGTAGVLDGQVQLDLGGLLQFATGQITSIASDGSLRLDATSFLADAGATTSNSALTGLSDIAGSLTLNNGASITTTGPLTISGTLTLQGGGTFTTGGALTNAAAGAIDLTGGGTATPATLIVDAAAGFGAAGVLDGQVELDGNALIQFASGQITEIAAGGNLTLSGANNVIADAGATSGSSALTGLADNAGTLALEGGASLTTTAALTNSGTVELYGTSSLTTGALANSGTVSLAGGTYTTTGALTNTGFIDLNTNSALEENQPSSLIVEAAAGFGTAGVVEGQVDLEGDALIQFDSGQITSIAQGAALTLGDSTADVADAGATTSNSALVGLASNAGTLTLENGATLTTSGPLANTGTIDLTNFLTNGTAPTLDINSAAGFGTAGVVDGQVEIGNANVSSGALLEFASGQITSIAGDGSLSLNGANAYLADAGATTSDSALALVSNAGTFSLSGGASVTTPGALSNTGTINLSAATLNVNSAAGFGTAGVLTGQVELTDSQLTFADGGQITGIAANSSLSLDGATASLADAGGTGTNSALSGLTSNAGTFSVADGASATVNDFKNTGDLEFDSFKGAGFGAVGLGFVFSAAPGGGVKSQALAQSDATDPTLMNTGTMGIGNFQLGETVNVTVEGGLTNTGTISVTGTEVGFSGGTPNIAVLDVTTTAGFGTTGVLTGQVNLAGYALVEFASGQITSIAADSGLSIEGAHAFVADGNAMTTADAMAINSDSALALTSNAGTLALSDGASMTVAAGTTLANAGTLYLDVDPAADPNSNGEGGSTLTISGTLTSSGTVVIGLGAGSGTASGTTVNGAGTLAITGGTATINAGATVSVATITIGDPATLELAGGATSSAIAFTPNADGTLKIDAAVLPATGGTFANAISGFAAGDTIDLAGLVYAGNPLAIYDGTTLTVTEGGVTDTLTVSTAGLPLFEATSDGNGGTDVTIVCFASGTRIRTIAGDVAVEALAVGDLVVTASGASRPIRWLGHRTIACRLHPRVNEVMPIRVATHAFGANRPARDLLVSPGHAICVDVMGEVLIPALALVDGESIAQVAVETVTYWHVELYSHDILLAENLPAESYLEMGNRGFFREAGLVALDGCPDAPIRTHADFCRPYVAGGPLLDAARARLAARASAPFRPEAAGARRAA